MVALFFIAWELRGTYPDIFKDPYVGDKAKEVYDDAVKLLSEIVDGKLIQANGVYGLFPANAVGDDIEIYTDESRTGILTIAHNLRQQSEKSADQFNKSLSDFIAPKETGLKDYVGAFAVTTGINLDELAAKYEKDNDDYNSIMVKALADRLAEAFAEYLHKKVRNEWGYGASEDFTVTDLIKERYRGIRPAPGYPACPDHTEFKVMFDLLHATGKHWHYANREHGQASCQLRQSTAGTSPIPKPNTSPSVKSKRTRSKTTAAARGATIRNGTLAVAQPKLRPRRLTVAQPSGPKSYLPIPMWERIEVRGAAFAIKYSLGSIRIRQFKPEQCKLVKFALAEDF